MGKAARVAALAVVIGSAVLAVAFATRFGSDPGLSPSPLIGKQAPELSLPMLDGDGEVALSDLVDEVIVVNFYASWCIQCRSEHAALVATAEAYLQSDVRFLQISYQDDPDDTRQMLEELGRSAATLYLTDPGSRAAIAFGLRGVPETFFIAPGGEVVAAIRGESNALLLSGTIEAIRRGERPGFQSGGEFQPVE